MFWLLIIIFAVAAVLFLSIKLWTVQRFWKDQGIAYDKPIPFFGIMLPFVLQKKCVAEIITDLYHKYSKEKYFGCHMFSKPFLVLRDPDIIKLISIKDFDYFSEHRDVAPEGAEPLFHKTLFAVKEDKWKHLRPAMSPAFTSSKMKVIFSIMEECAEHYIELLLKTKSDTFAVELKDIFTRFANDIIASTAFGVKCNSVIDENNQFYRMSFEINNITGLTATKAFLFNAFPKVMKTLNLKIFSAKATNFFRSVIQETIKQREELGVVRPDIIQLLLEARKRENQKNMNFEITYDDIVAQAFIFLLGGFDTTSTAMSFTAYELALNPKIQERLRAEVNQIWKQTNGNLTFDTVSQMKYLDMVVSESLRKYPPMFFMDRKCVRPYTFESSTPERQPLKFNPGQLIFLPAFSLHRDEKYFPDPERFDPERFNEENKSSIYPGSYLPFGVGPRNCIGARFAVMEIKTLIFHLIRNFVITPNKNTQIPLALKIQTVFLTAENGFHVDFKKIHV